tara:strand:- start:1162 stop:1755 length:594 start_codon:yes stop_codon:yes gene_type:complete
MKLKNAIPWEYLGDFSGKLYPTNGHMNYYEDWFYIGAFNNADYYYKLNPLSISPATKYNFSIVHSNSDGDYDSIMYSTLMWVRDEELTPNWLIMKSILITPSYEEIINRLKSLKTRPTNKPKKKPTKSNDILDLVMEMYKTEDVPSVNKQEIQKLAGLLTQVGGCAESILTKCDTITMAEFLDICFSNGITFDLRNG